MDHVEHASEKPKSYFENENQPNHLSKNAGLADRPGNKDSVDSRGGTRSPAGDRRAGASRARSDLLCGRLSGRPRVQPHHGGRHECHPRQTRALWQPFVRTGPPWRPRNPCRTESHVPAQHRSVLRREQRGPHSGECFQQLRLCSILVHAEPGSSPYAGPGVRQLRQYIFRKPGCGHPLSGIWSLEGRTPFPATSHKWTRCGRDSRISRSFT